MFEAGIHWRVKWWGKKGSYYEDFCLETFKVTAIWRLLLFSQIFSDFHSTLKCPVFTESLSTPSHCSLILSLFWYSKRGLSFWENHHVIDNSLREKARVFMFLNKSDKAKSSTLELTMRMQNSIWPRRDWKFHGMYHGTPLKSYLDQEGYKMSYYLFFTTVLWGGYCYPDHIVYQVLGTKVSVDPPGNHVSLKRLYV